MRALEPANTGTTLGLVIPYRREAWLCVAGLGAYLLTTMSRDLSYFDSPELAMVAVEGGLSHPPGQVLHTLLGALAVRLLPFSDLTILNGLSAVCGALCLMPTLAVAEFSFRMDSRESALSPRWYPCLTVALCHPVLWEQATRVEVYALATLLSLWTLARGLTTEVGEPRNGLWLGIGAGLTASANPVFAILVVVALAPGLVLRGTRLRFIAWAGFGALLGLLPYAYLPWVARREHAFVWGELGHARGLLHYLTGADFQQNLAVTPTTWVAQAIDLFLRESGRWLWAIPLFGIASVVSQPSWWKHKLALVLCLFFAVGYVARNVVWNPDIPDYLSYLAPALHACAAAAIALCARLWVRHMRVASLLTVVTLCGTSLFAPPNLRVRARASDRSARVLAAGLLSSMPKGGIAILGSDHIAWPVLYLQRVEGVRRDVVVFPRGLSSSSWFWDGLMRDHPDLSAFELRGPGSATGRIRRFLDAQGARPVVAENPALLSEAGRPSCAGPWFVYAESPCRAHSQELFNAARAVQQLVDQGVMDDPTSAGALSAVAYNQAENAMRLGEPAAALQYALSVLPREERSLGAKLSPAALDKLPAWRGPSVVWQRRVPLGDPARCAWFASSLAAAAGQEQLALRWRRLAADMGLPEAIAQLTNQGPP